MYMKYLTFFVAVIMTAAVNGLKSHDTGMIHKFNNNAINELKLLNEKMIKYGHTAEHMSEERRLGVKGNGVSYLISDQFDATRNGSSTCDMNIAGLPMYSAIALSNDGPCTNDNHGTGSTRNTGCYGDTVVIDAYEGRDCMGMKTHSYEYPLPIGCHPRDTQSYISMHCRVKYPFKNQGGLLHTVFHSVDACLKNDHPWMFNLVPTGACMGEFRVDSCKNNHFEASVYDSETDHCTGSYQEHALDLHKNNQENCMGMDDGEQHDEFFSRKCANNHMYPKD